MDKKTQTKWIKWYKGQETKRRISKYIKNNFK